MLTPVEELVEDGGELVEDAGGELVEGGMELVEGGEDGAEPLDVELLGIDWLGIE